MPCRGNNLFFARRYVLTRNDGAAYAVLATWVMDILPALPLVATTTDPDPSRHYVRAMWRALLR
jgi:hypothetical protein